MIKLNNEVLQQFEKSGLSINEGIVLDARLVKSANRPLGNEDMKELKKKRYTSEGKIEKRGKPLKFSRDLESDWTIKNKNSTNHLNKGRSMPRNLKRAY